MIRQPHKKIWRVVPSGGRPHHTRTSNEHANVLLLEQRRVLLDFNGICQSSGADKSLLHHDFN
eukprot:2261927-Amphidinium_carterae.1